MPTITSLSLYICYKLYKLILRTKGGHIRVKELLGKGRLATEARCLKIATESALLPLLPCERKRLQKLSSGAYQDLGPWANVAFVRRL